MPPRGATDAEVPTRDDHRRVHDEYHDDGLEYDEDEDEVDRDAGLRSRALPADGEPDYAAGPPADGFEYLRRVRHEASNVPDVMVAPSFDPRAFDDARTPYAPPSALDPGFPKPPPHATPDDAWSRAFVADFANLRSEVARRAATTKVSVPFGRARGGGERNGEMDGSTSWVGVAGATLADLSREALARMRRDETDDDGEGGERARAALFDEGEADDAPRPSSRALAAADEVTVAAALRAHAWAMGSALSGGGTLSRFRAAWFFALASRAGTPLDADTTAAIRSAARGLATARAATKSAEDPTLPDLQVCVAVAGKYFGQGEE